MTYQFERSEIKQCQNCDFAFGGGNLKINERYCSRQDEIIDGYKKTARKRLPSSGYFQNGNNQLRVV